MYDQSRISIDTFTSADDKTQPFNHAISEAFIPYLSVWVEAQDKYVFHSFLIIFSP
jgi:hypothetical protein